METTLQHIPIMVEEICRLLLPEDKGFILDGTFGGGGHTRAFLNRSSEVKVIGIDCDPDAIERAGQLNEAYSGRFKFYSQNFSEIKDLEESNFTGILLDLGVSSFQLDDGSRGFSFRENAPVDMRLDNRQGLKAATFLERGRETELIQAIRDFGEEPHWRKIVTAIIKERGTGRLSTTEGLVNIVTQALGERVMGRRSRIHPATLTFQGIRMYVNQELLHLEMALPMAFEKLAVGGVLAILSFHSLEDRLVKRFFRKLAGKPEHRWDDTPQENRFIKGELLMVRPWVPSEAEIKNNPRSRSAKLRAIRRLF